MNRWKLIQKLIHLDFLIFICSFDFCNLGSTEFFFILHFLNLSFQLRFSITIFMYNSLILNFWFDYPDFNFNCRIFFFFLVRIPRSLFWYHWKSQKVYFWGGSTTILYTIHSSFTQISVSLVKLLKKKKIQMLTFFLRHPIFDFWNCEYEKINFQWYTLLFFVFNSM